LAHKGHRGSEYYGFHPEYKDEYRKAHKFKWNDEESK
jgi:hypothetical protein